jgi:hypothetical protein
MLKIVLMPLAVWTFIVLPSPNATNRTNNTV